MKLDSTTIGQNIAKYRLLKDIKAFDLAERIGMKESTYTKYERGETSITIDFVKKVADALEIDPMAILSITPSNIFENLSNSPVAIHSSMQTSNEQQTVLLLKLMESVVAVNERIVTLLEDKN